MEIDIRRAADPHGGQDVGPEQREVAGEAFALQFKLPQEPSLHVNMDAFEEIVGTLGVTDPVGSGSKARGASCNVLTPLTKPSRGTASGAEFCK